MILNKKSIFLTALFLSFSISSFSFAMEEEENKNNKISKNTPILEVKKKQTLKEICPEIEIGDGKEPHCREVKILDNITEKSKYNFLFLLTNNEKFLNYFKNRYVYFSGLNDQHIEFIENSFQKLLTNNVHFIIHNCRKNSLLDGKLSEFYSKFPGSFSVYTNDGITLTDWIENSEYHKEMLNLIEEPQFDNTYTLEDEIKENKKEQKRIEANDFKGDEFNDESDD